MESTQKRYLALQAIKNKLKGRTLSYREIFAVMDEIASDRLGDILTTYFAAAGFSSGFSSDELYYCTKAMVETGTQLHFPGIVADKHSIGGVAGTRTTMLVVPIIVSAGYTMPKTSSRAITSPAGTADVMEVLSKVEFFPEQVTHIVNTVGGCIIWGGHLGIAPADDVIIRVEEPLAFESFDKIIVSIMAKKIAASTNHLVIDLPVGPTMKIRREKDAIIVQKKFEQIAKKFGIIIHVDINHTQEPAGVGIGPVLEAIDVLKVLEQTVDRPIHLEERAIRLAGKLLNLCFATEKKPANGEQVAQSMLRSGKALEAFQRIIQAQHGNPRVSSKSLTKSKIKKNCTAATSGTIMGINNFHLNAIARILGAPHDKKAGMELMVRKGDTVKENDVVTICYSSSEHRLNEAIETLSSLPIYKISAS